MFNASRKILKFNLIFIFIFLNVWDFAVSRILFNAMFVGIFMFGPIAFLAYLGRIKAIALLTLFSIVEFLMMTTFVLEGFQLSGVEYSLKSIYWLPFLIVAGI